MIKRGKYSIEYKNWLIENAPKYTMQELIKISKEKFCYKEINRKKIRSILSKITDVKWKDYDIRKVANVNFNEKPIGYESTRKDGMTKIKVGNKKWVYKQRYIWEQHYGELPEDCMIIFLDCDRSNYNIDNLMAVKTREYNYIKNKGLLSDNAELNKTALLSAKLDYKTKDIEKLNRK